MFNQKKPFSLQKIISFLLLSVVAVTTIAVLAIRYINFVNKEDNRISISKVPRTALTEKPIVLENNLPNTNLELESFGDKLAQAEWHLRQQHSELALKELNEAQSETAIRADDNSNENRIMWRDLNNRLSQAETNLQWGNSRQASVIIDGMLQELDSNQK